uniref:Uncharacterized protein n=1 Tax=Fagus sylvatica TaxID=28930 RepID=A0A2N9H5G8_FAGSY
MERTAQVNTAGCLFKISSPFIGEGSSCAFDILGKEMAAYGMWEAVVEQGELLDWMYAGSLSLHSKNVDLQCKKDETQRLLKFMTDHQPHVIVLGAANLIPSSIVFPGLSRLYKL